MSQRDGRGGRDELGGGSALLQDIPQLETGEVKDRAGGEFHVCLGAVGMNQGTSLVKCS